MPVYKYSFDSSVLALECYDRLRKYMAVFVRNLTIPVPIIILSLFPVWDSLSKKQMWMTPRGIYTGIYYIVILFWLLAGPWILRGVYLKQLRNKMGKKINKEGLYTIEFYEDYMKEIRIDTTRMIYYNEIVKYVIDKKGNLILTCKLAGDLLSFDRISPGSYYSIVLPANIAGKEEIDKVTYFLNSRRKGDERHG